MALQIGSPVARSHTSVVSRWLVMPIAAMSRAREAGLRQRLARGRELALPDLARVVLDPAGLRVDLAELALRHRDDAAVAVEDDAARAGGALVEGEEVAGSGHAVALRGWADARIAAMPRAGPRRDPERRRASRTCRHRRRAAGFRSRCRRARRRRRHQRRRHRARPRRPRPLGAAVREGRPRAAHLVGVDQADPRRPALPRALRVRAGAQGARRTRGAAAERPAHHVAAALRDAARPVDAAGLDDPRRPLPLRPPGAGARCCRASRTVDLRAHPAGAPLKPEFRKGFVYSDGWVDDARLVVLCAVDAAERGATVLTRTRCVDAARSDASAGQRASSTPSGAARRVRGARARQCDRPVGGAVPHRTGACAPPAHPAPRQGQPHRRAASCSSTTTPTSSRTPTAASSSRSPTRTTSR